jgi:hypothetical protein
MNDLMPEVEVLLLADFSIGLKSRDKVTQYLVADLSHYYVRVFREFSRTYIHCIYELL